MNYNIFEELANANSLLRSAYSITLRDGKDTNWEAFKRYFRTRTSGSKRILGTSRLSKGEMD